MMKPAVLTFVVAATLLLGGCINLDPVPDPTRYYVLGTAHASRGELLTEGLRIGIREVSLPKYLESSRIALRRGTNEIIYLPFERWGEDMGVSAGRSLASTLERQAGTRYVSIFPWPTVIEHDYVLRVQFAHFEGTKDGDVIVSGRWILIDPGRNRVATTRSFDLGGKWDGSDYSQLAGMLSDSLELLGRQIAQAISLVAAEQADNPDDDL